MSRVRVKICGLREIDNALKAVECGADAIGFVFYDKSPRFVDEEKVRGIIKEIPSMVNKVGVFVNHSIDEILRYVETGIDTIQLHGDSNFYNAEFILKLKERTSLSIIYAIRIQKLSDEIINLPLVKEVNNLVSSILVDKLSDKEYGGTGESFFIENISNKEFLRSRIILAGGINEKNILQILSKIKPYAIDISSGVEKEKGVKDNKLIENFFKVFNQYYLNP